MRPSKFSDLQVTEALQQVRNGTPAVNVCRKLGITQTTFYRWRKLHQGGGVSNASEVRELRDENQKLREIVANFLLDKFPLKRSEVAGG